jgi:hypothetical protein
VTGILDAKLPPALRKKVIPFIPTGSTDPTGTPSSHWPG